MLSFSTRAGRVEHLARQLFAEHGLVDWSFEFNRRKLHMGLCLFGPRQIALSIYFVELNNDDSIRDTLLHEIAHALVGPGHGHDAVWKAKCLEVGARPERLCSEAIMPLGSWHAICPGCGRLHHRHRRPKHMVGWHCSYCGRERGRLTWIHAGLTPEHRQPCGAVP
jgi:predicted SprT family Zn-dependent metalloprotease